MSPFSKVMGGDQSFLLLCGDGAEVVDSWPHSSASVSPSPAGCPRCTLYHLHMCPQPHARLLKKIFFKLKDLVELALAL